MDGETKAYLDDMKADLKADLKGEVSTLRADMDRRFDDMDRRFDQVMDLVQVMATGTAQRFDSVETRLDAIERRIAGQAAPVR